MTRARLIWNSVLYYWRTNLAVLTGVAVATAVLTGALIVGDSVRGSLRDMTLVRLGRIDFSVAGGRFFREQLAADLAANPDVTSQFEHVVPALILPGSLERTEGQTDRVLSRAGQVQLYGIDDRFQSLTTSQIPTGDELILSARAAEALQVAVGDAVRVTVELPSAIPRDSLLGEKDETVTEISTTVKAVLAEESPQSRFGLQPNQQSPMSAFLSLKTLQERLGLDEQRRTRRRAAQSAKVNALLISARETQAAKGPASAALADRLEKAIQATWTLDDLGLRAVPQSTRGYLSLESPQMVLDDTLAAAANRVAQKLQLSTSPVLLYLINEMTAGKGEKAYVLYSTIAGLDAALLQPGVAPPFGPFEFVAPAADTKADGSALQADEIILNDWAAADLKASVGDTVQVKYYLSGSKGELPEETRRFKVRGIVSVAKGAGNDRGLTPEVPGITDAESLADWDQPFPMDLTRITSRDDEYWDEYRGTPKAFLSLSTAQELFRNRYGQLTSIRFAPAAGQSLEQTAEQVTRELLKTIAPAEIGLAVQPIKAIGLSAATGTNEFGGLFIGFSFFLIVAALTLTALLVRLSLEQRATSIGLLLACGYRFQTVRALLFQEGALVITAACGLGLVCSAAYALLMVYGLTTWWRGAIGTRFLQVHLEPLTLLIGGAISALIAGITLWWGSRPYARVSVRSLLQGQPPQGDDRVATSPRWSLLGAAGSGIAAGLVIVTLVTGIVPPSLRLGPLPAIAVGFFISGMLALTSALLMFRVWLIRPRQSVLQGSGWTAAVKLGQRNATRSRLRSQMTVTMISLATFLIVVIAAARQNPARNIPDKTSGNGGFTLVAETNVPVTYDLNTAAGRAKLNLDDAAAQKTLQAATAIIPFRVNPGENASCLNVFQTRQPTILGVTDEMIARGGFALLGAAGKNPWEVLQQADQPAEQKASASQREPAAEPEPVPVFGDLNTLQYSMHVGLGQVITLHDHKNQPYKARIAGMFAGSVFQGVLLMSRQQFERLYPTRSGYQYFLIETPPEHARELSDLLESRIAGLDVDRVNERLADFLAVQNTYLSTFQALGSLGLLLGTVGLAIVMMRNVLERRSEFALLRALGYRPGRVALLVLSENGWLLGAGLISGTLAALLAMLPQLTSQVADIDWRGLILQLLLITAAGMAAAWLAVRVALRTPIVETLRGE